ncbi:hypothetical protein QNH48_15050 [Neobacillus sp. YX16]|uniref:hypothetical protein n=1 Tax=Neobacillus sp. YX16 TaxID=3047874 RepID=UPI0024C3AD55|nr:hypothetical protein [Neobacillus sp. YX16]WHZ05857.1 hypothetical protein QNH48_15050 [Neobacillus sp. YX16]
MVKQNLYLIGMPSGGERNMCGFLVGLFILYMILSVVIGIVVPNGDIAPIISMVIIAIILIIGLIRFFSERKDNVANYGDHVVTTKGRLFPYGNTFNGTIEVFNSGFKAEGKFHYFSDILDITVNSYRGSSTVVPFSREIVNMEIKFKNGREITYRKNDNLEEYQQIRNAFLNYDPHENKGLNSSVQFNTFRKSNTNQSIEIYKNSFSLNGTVYFFSNIEFMEVSSGDNVIAQLKFIYKSGTERVFRDSLIGRLSEYQKVKKAFEEYSVKGKKTVRQI